MADAITKAEKKQIIDAAWAEYRAAAKAIPNVPWDEYLDADDRLWRRYVTTERAVLAAPVLALLRRDAYGRA